MSRAVAHAPPRWHVHYARSARTPVSRPRIARIRIVSPVDSNTAVCDADGRGGCSKGGHTMMSRSVVLRCALAVSALLALLALATGAVAQAAGSATISDNAGLFTSAG